MQWWQKRRWRSRTTSHILDRASETNWKPPEKKEGSAIGTEVVVQVNRLTHILVFPHNVWLNQWFFKPKKNVKNVHLQISVNLIPQTASVWNTRSPPPPVTNHRRTWLEAPSNRQRCCLSLSFFSYGAKKKPAKIGGNKNFKNGRKYGEKKSWVVFDRLWWSLLVLGFSKSEKNGKRWRPIANVLQGMSSVNRWTYLRRWN